MEVGLCGCLMWCVIDVCGICCQAMEVGLCGCLMWCMIDVCGICCQAMEVGLCGCLMWCVWYMLPSYGSRVVWLFNVVCD